MSGEYIKRLLCLGDVDAKNEANYVDKGVIDGHSE